MTAAPPRSATASALGPYMVWAQITESPDATRINVVFARPAKYAPMFSSEVFLSVATLDGSTIEVAALDKNRFLPEITSRDNVCATATFVLKGDAALLSGKAIVGCDYGKKALDLVRLPADET